MVPAQDTTASRPTTGADDCAGSGGGQEQACAVSAGPVRTCIVTRRESHPADLIRFVLDPADVVIPDLQRRLPGRGVWVTLDRQLLAEAVRKKAFARAFRRPVIVPDDLVTRVEALLERRISEALSLANKAGLVVTGFESVYRAIEGENIACVVHGSDAAADGAGKVDWKYAAICRDRSVRPTILAPLTIEQLSLAIGRSTVVHACVSTGRAGANFVQAAGRLIRFRSGAGASTHANEASPAGDGVATAGRIPP